MTNNQQTLHSEIFAHLENGLSRDEITTTLVAQGHDHDLVHSAVKAMAEKRHEKNRTEGMHFVLVGAVICFLSFLLTITSSFSHSSFPWVLYGLTSIGIVVAFRGLMKVF